MSAPRSRVIAAARLPRLPILDGTTLPQHRPPPRKLTLDPYAAQREQTEAAPMSFAPDALRQWALDAGADDVGIVSLRGEVLMEQRTDIERLLPGARTAIAFVIRMQRENIRNPARSVANQEFHGTIDEANHVGRALALELERRGHRAISPAGGFPMEIGSFPGKIWPLSYKPIAVAAGLGQMGIHRNVIHPRFGSFVSIGVVLTDLDVTDPADEPIDFNPCLGCRLCVAACPVGAIASDGAFDFAACSTHNYREFMGGFTDWVEEIAESKGRADYRARVPPGDTASMWQSLSFGANYKAAYCLAVCPAGSDVIGPYLRDKTRHLEEVMRPLTSKIEPLFVVPGSNAEAHARKRFPHKEIRQVGSGILPTTVATFVAGAPLLFASEAAKDVSMRVHFAFRGEGDLAVTFVIDSGKLEILEGHEGARDLLVDVDGATWLGIVRGERSPVWAVLTRRLRVTGPTRMLKLFQRCFPR